MRIGTTVRRFGGSLAFALGVTVLLLAGLLEARRARGNAFVQLDFNISSVGRLRDSVFIELFDDRPLTRDNFLQYVNGGHYDNSLMHRLARLESGEPFVLQGGGFYREFQTEPPPLNTSLDPAARVDLDNDPTSPLPTVPNEFGNQPPRSNVRGTIAMAKTPDNPDSATSQFFFNLRDNGGTAPNGLDFQNGGFTVFGHVVGDGMGLVDLYASLPVLNLNPDLNDDGVRDGTLFIDVPILPAEQSFLPLVIERAKRVDYFGAGSPIDVPATGLTFSERDAFIDTGATFTGTGQLIVGPGRTLGIREGLQLDRALDNHGTLAPGLQLGPIGLDGYRQFLGGTLEIQLRNTGTAPLYDQLVVDGVAFLSGVLDLSLAPGYTPNHGDSFAVVIADEIVGNFVAADLPLLSDGLVWDYTRTSTAIIVSVARADYNGNGVVDAADYVVWRGNLGQTGTGLAADGNGDGKIDSVDYSVWAANFGNIAGNMPATNALVSGAVPEPSSTALMLTAGGLLMARRARRARISRTTYGA